MTLRIQRACLLAAAWLLGGAASLLAQAPARPQPPPVPGLQRPEHRRLAFLLGQWEEEVRYAGQETPGRGRWFARPELGLYLVIRYQGTGPQGPYGAFGILTYDAEGRNYRMWWFDSAGGTGDYRGNWQDETTLVLEHQGRVEGRAFRERISYTRVAPGEVRTRIEQAWDEGEFALFLEATARRTGDAPVPQAPAAPRRTPPPQP
jgi:hypothetical protein